MKIYRKYTTYGSRINIEEGEKYCPACNGKGCKIKPLKTFVVDIVYTSNTNIICGTCGGNGKVDWVQNVTKSSLSVNKNAILDAMDVYNISLKLRREIDDEILESIRRVANNEGDKDDS